MTTSRSAERAGQAPVAVVPVRRRLLSDGSLTKRATLNAAAALIDYGAQVIVALVATPFLVRGLGSFLYGVWQVLQRLLGQAAAATGRPGEALKWVVAHEQTSDDFDEKRRTVGSAVVVWFLFLPLLLLLGGAFSWLAPSWLNVPAGSVTTVRVAAWLVVLTFIGVSLVYLPQSVLHGENLAYKRIGLSAGVLLVGGALTITAVVAGAGLVGVAAAGLVATVLSGAVYLYIVRRQVPWFGVARPRPAAVRHFLGLSSWFMLWNLVMQVMQGADVVVLGIAGSATLVTAYSLTRYVPDAVTTVAATVIFAVMPGLGGLIGAGDRGRAVDVRNELMSITWLLTAASAATVLAWEQCFLGLWVGERYYPGTPTMALITVMVLQWAVIRTDSNIIDLTLVLRDKVLLGLLSAVVCVGLSTLLVAGFRRGIDGVVVGFIAGRLVLSVAYPWQIGRLLGVPARRQLAAAVRPALVTVGMLAASAGLASRLAGQSWVALIAGGLVTAVAFLAVGYAAGLSRGQRKRVRTRVHRVLQLT